ncbi:ATP-binding protein [Nocardiopsis dassonvillei]|uniref:ATP-binding protein n=1 Tax=Nocardiopsis dassonvillei TaxID=2014 RepID=UPI0034072BEB
MNLPVKKPRVLQREQGPLLEALRTGVVPGRGAQLIQVGREKEIAAILDSLKHIRVGAGTSRFVIGDYGSGKTYFLRLMCMVAHREDLVTVHADLTPDRRLHGSQGRARKLYSELVANMATRGRPGGRALTSVVERFVGRVEEEAETEGVPVRDLLRSRLRRLREHPAGPTFARVVEAYWEAYHEGDENRRDQALRWLHAEYAIKSEARDLGVREIIDDRNVFDNLKLLADFVTMAGYRGLLVCLDEMVNLYKINHAAARKSNYEQILNIINDTQQGLAPHLGFLFGGTPDFLTNPHRGLYSYEALRSRLEENPYAGNGLVDYHGPVMRLGSFTKEHFYELLKKVRDVYTSNGQDLPGFTDDAVEAFMRHCDNRVGEAYFRTPRSTIKEFVGLMDVLRQNPQARWTDLLPRVELAPEANPDLLPTTAQDTDDDEHLAAFRM